MMPTNDSLEDPRLPKEFEEEAAKAFFQREAGDWTAQDQADLEVWLADPVRAEAFQNVTDTWRVLGSHAVTPEVIAFRQEALGGTRGAGSRRWSGRNLVSHWRWAAAAVMVMTIGLYSAQFRNNVSESAYETGIGERRVVELEDRSRIALDALTTLRVRMARDSRVIELTQGRAYFTVAKDPKRPFRVEAGKHTITAVGTSFNVEYLYEKMGVAMVEGRVAVSVAARSGTTDDESGRRVPFAVARRTIELIAGQALTVGSDGQSLLIPDADIAAATAWQQGRVIFTDTLLSDAVRELNRYSRLQVKITDPSLGALRVSGVFEAGNMQAFIGAVRLDLPVSVRQVNPELVLLSPGPEPD